MIVFLLLAVIVGLMAIGNLLNLLSIGLQQSSGNSLSIMFSLIYNLLMCLAWLLVNMMWEKEEETE
jgi:hypothetical protein